MYATKFLNLGTLKENTSNFNSLTYFVMVTRLASFNLNIKRNKCFRNKCLPVAIVMCHIAIPYR